MREFIARKADGIDSLKKALDDLLAFGFTQEELALAYTEKRGEDLVIIVPVSGDLL